MARTLVTTAYSSRLDSMPIVALDTASAIEVEIGASAAHSSALTGGVYYFSPSCACRIAIGASAVASTGPANLPVHGAALFPLLVPAGARVSVIGSGGATGTLGLVPVAEG